MSRSRTWVFTINNPPVDEICKAWDGVAYCVWQKERGENGTPHLQGYVVFTNPRTLAGLKKVATTAHWEPRRGTHAQALAYSTKEDTRILGPWTIGVEPVDEPGKRTDLDALKEALDAGTSLEKIASEQFSTMAKYSRWAREYRLLTGKHIRSWLTYTTVYWGPPGTGKTRRVLAEAGPTAYWMKKPGQGQSLFFDGYDGEEDVVIDEFYGWIPHDLLCRMCDRYPLKVDTKGGVVEFAPKRIWITSNKRPQDWYPKVGLGAMERRLSGDLGKVIFMGEDDRVERLAEMGIHLGNQEDDLEIVSGQKRPRSDSAIPPAVENVVELSEESSELEE